MTAEPLQVFCDEAGFTGPRLLDPDQRLFSYFSVAMTDDDAFTILSAARRANPVQMAELKSSALLKTRRGTALVEDVLRQITGNYSFVVSDKLLVLCGKVFEYLYEPVFQHDPWLLYEKNLHRFVAMYCYIHFVGPEGEEAIRQFEVFMRSLDPTDAPMLFDPGQLARMEELGPFGMVVKFAQGYKELIVADNQRMRDQTPDAGKWALDISISGLWSLLNHWGRQGRALRVTCDNSKPLMAQAVHFTGGDADPGIARARASGKESEDLGYTLAEPIRFADSRSHPGLQVADLIAGAAVTVMSRGGGEFDGIRELLQQHIHRDCVMPDFDYARLGNSEVDVNWLVLMELGERAQRGDNPYAAYASSTKLPKRLGNRGDSATDRHIQ
jgi:hypothetical protein